MEDEPMYYVNEHLLKGHTCPRCRLFEAAFPPLPSLVGKTINFKKFDLIQEIRSESLDSPDTLPG